MSTAGPRDASLVELARDVRRTILTVSHRANVGHIGSALSVTEILAVLFGSQLHGDAADPERDRFVMAKGHAALALYAVLAATGRMPQHLLATFCTDGTSLGVHPERGAPGIDFSTGSLGQGLSIGVGAALAAKRQGSDRRVFVLLSDAECNEGSVWESVMFAAHHRLGNLVAIVDDNRQQALGYTDDVLSLRPLGARWSAFGWNASELDGHDVHALDAALGSQDRATAPHVLVARTVFGKGVSFMEGEIPWHYKTMSADEYVQALAEVEAA